MLDKQLQKEHEEFRRRREAINDLSFTYKRLLRLIPALFRRAPEPRLANVLREQHVRDITSEAELTKVAMDLGQPPGPCVCAEADTLVEDVYNADRAGSTAATRTWGIVKALKTVRVHLMRTWGRLIGEVDPSVGERSLAQKEAAAAQQEEAAQHRQLVEFTNELEEGMNSEHDGGQRRNSA